MASAASRGTRSGGGAPSSAPVRDGVALLLAGLAARLGVALWAAPRIRPVADATYYDAIARRIAAGLGYTWAWEDGSVTYAAHYPVGYPALLGGLYRLFGAHLAVAMIANAAIGSVAVFGAHRIAARGGDRRIAATAAALVALHPGLVSYTPALMTEGVSATLVTVALWLGLRASERASLARHAMTGVAIAAAAYVRPQSLVLVAAPWVLLAKGTPLREAVARAASATLAIALAAALSLAPWTARNCARMHRCALVSVNDGWNLLIGTDRAAAGTWAPVEVPPECEGVFDEAEKNACFGRAATRRIEEAPLAWLSLVPMKLGRTFDYCGAGPWYLHEASPEAFSQTAKVALGGVEVAFERLSIAACLVAVWRRAKRLAPTPRRVGLAAVAAGAVFDLVPHAGYLAVICLLAGLGATLRDEERPPPAFALALFLLAATALVHAVFFGAGRYAMVTFPVVSALAAFALAPRAPAAGPSFDSRAEDRHS